jgi:type II secretory pathway pseudopilin PulG
MKATKRKTAVTLVEILVVVGVVSIFITAVIRITARIENQSRRHLMESTFSLLDTALEAFRDAGFGYGHTDYRSLHFPPDCSGYSSAALVNTLRDALNATSVAIDPPEGHDPSYSGSEGVYFFLSRLPECRQVLERIDESLVTNKGLDGRLMNLVVDDRFYPLCRFADCWGTAIRYDYYDETAATVASRDASMRGFPLLVSAGPDRMFGTGDDIANR